MSKSRAAGRASLLAAALAAAACGPAPGSRVLPESEVLAPSGALRPSTVERLLLIDAARAGSRVVAVGDQGYIVLSDDGGATWRRAAGPDAPLLTAIVFADEKHGWAVGHDMTILATADGGATWSRQLSAPSEKRPLLDVLFLDARHGIAVGAYGAYEETLDGGLTWTARKIIPEDRHFNAIVRVPGTTRLLIFGEEGTILASSNEGRDWTKVPSPYKGSLFGGVAAGGGSIVAFGLRGRILRSTDGGESWALVDDRTTATLMGGSVLADGSVAIAGGAGTVLVSRDGGRSFEPLPTRSARAFSTVIAGRANAAIVLGEGGPHELALPPPAR